MWETMNKMNITPTLYISKNNMKVSYNRNRKQININHRDSEECNQFLTEK